MPGGQTGLGCSSPDISRPIYAELLLIRFLSCPWEPLCGISRISPGISLCIFPGCHPVPPPASCPLHPGSPKRVNLVRLYFFINLSGSAQLARHTWAPRLPTADYSYFAYPLIEGYAPLPGRARATRRARGYRGLADTELRTPDPSQSEWSGCKGLRQLSAEAVKDICHNLLTHVRVRVASSVCGDGDPGVRDLCSLA